MPKIKISADTTPIKKSILDISKEIEKITKGGKDASLISEKERKFITVDMNRAIKDMHANFAKNQREIVKLNKEATKLVKGTKEELRLRKQINGAYRVQSRLSKEIAQVERAKSQMGGAGGYGGAGGMMAMMKNPAIAAAMMIGGAGIGAAFKGSAQYRRGTADRVRLHGLGVDGGNEPDGGSLARAGLTPQEYNKRRLRSVGQLGRGSEGSLMQQSRFERSRGLEGGSLLNASTSMRANFGGKGADNTQMKLQASIFGAGIEDALAPYLEATTTMLNEINENGITQTDGLLNAMSILTKSGERTPEQIAKVFTTISGSIKGASGEQSAFLQSAFAKGGVGGGKIGATRLAMESGGLFGLDEKALKVRGYSTEQITSLRESKLTGSASERMGGILSQAKASGGMGQNDQFSNVTDVSQMAGLSQMGNSVFGTTGLQGFDALQLLEKVQNKDMTQVDFEAKIKEMKESGPEVDRLNDINSTLAGSSTISQNILDVLRESVGKHAEPSAKSLDNIQKAVFKATGFTLEKANESGVTSFMEKLTSGALLDDLSGFLKKQRESREGTQGIHKYPVIENKVELHLTGSDKTVP